MFSAINLRAQDELIVLVGQVVTFKFDELTLQQQRIHDSIQYANGTWTNDTTDDGAIVSTGPVVYMRMSNPYILKVKVKKSFSKSFNYDSVEIRIWEHENPEYFIKPEYPFLFILSQKDSFNIYSALDYYRVFQTLTGKWAEPVRTRNKPYPKAKKAIVKYELLKELETDYFQLIADEQECCQKQLRQYYGTEEKENKTEPNNK